MSDDRKEDAEEALARAQSVQADAAGIFEQTIAQLASTAAELQHAVTQEDGEQLSREDLEAGLRFIHLVLVHTRDQLSSLQVAHDALATAVIEHGLDEAAVIENRKLPLLRERERRSAQPDLRLTAVDDKYAFDGTVTLDCIERLPLCKARCCSLDFELAEQDLDEGVVRWDYGRPYVIRKTAEGVCVHNAEGKCTVYGARPASCRSYDCRDDRRIWLDFENRIPAP